MPDLRYKTVRRPYTKWQRLRAWWHGIVVAIREMPPSHYADYIEVKEGDPDYVTAPFTVCTVCNPMKFTIENGQYKQVE